MGVARVLKNEMSSNINLSGVILSRTNIVKQFDNYKKQMGIDNFLVKLLPSLISEGRVLESVKWNGIEGYREFLKGMPRIGKEISLLEKIIKVKGYLNNNGKVSIDQLGIKTQDDKEFLLKLAIKEYVQFIDNNNLKLTTRGINYFANRINNFKANASDLERKELFGIDFTNDETLIKIGEKKPKVNEKENKSIVELSKRNSKKEVKYLVTDAECLDSKYKSIKMLLSGKAHWDFMDIYKERPINKNNFLEVLTRVDLLPLGNIEGYYEEIVFKTDTGIIRLKGIIAKDRISESYVRLYFIGSSINRFSSGSIEINEPEIKIKEKVHNDESLLVRYDKIVSQKEMELEERTKKGLKISYAKQHNYWNKREAEESGIEYKFAK